MAYLEPYLRILGPFQSLAANLGILLVLYLLGKVVYYTLRNIYVYYFAEGMGQTVDFKSLGEWAVVTGATDGIGKGYVFDLGRRGCNVVLISRTEDKLRTVAKEIESKYPKIRTKIVVADFTHDESIYDHIRRELEVNNVGLGHPYPEYFSKMPGGDKFAIDMIRCNVVAQTMMTRIVLPQMADRKKGVVVNLSSGAGANPIPMLSLYSATKAFNDFLGRALKLEYESQGIIFQVIQPYMVATNMSGVHKTSLFVLDPMAYARGCLNSVGFFSRTNGHMSHNIQNWVSALAPNFVTGKMVMYAMKKWRDAAVGRLKRKGLYKEE